MPDKSGRGGADVPGVKTNEREGTRAVLRHNRTSAYKVRQVLDLIRGQDVDRAAEILALGDREAAVTVAKVLASAVANAAHNDGLDPEELFVSACYADEGSTLKRWRPRARGRATRIRKRSSHITIIVSRMPEDRIARRRAQQAANASQRSRRVAGSRRRQRNEAAESTPAVEAADTGAEAWSEDATHADDLVTETEAGPLEESDFDEDDEVETTDTDETDTDTDTDAEGDDDTDAEGEDSAEDVGVDPGADQPDDHAEGETAEEKGK
jgi:large subunit ribosomal protein L22